MELKLCHWGPMLEGKSVEVKLCHARWTMEVKQYHVEPVLVGRT